MHGNVFLIPFPPAPKRILANQACSHTFQLSCQSAPAIIVCTCSQYFSIHSWSYFSKYKHIKITMLLNRIVITDDERMKAVNASRSTVWAPTTHVNLLKLMNMTFLCPMGFISDHPLTHNKGKNAHSCNFFVGFCRILWWCWWTPLCESHCVLMRMKILRARSVSFITVTDE